MKHETRKPITAILMIVAVMLTVSAAGAYESDAIDPPIGPIIYSLNPDAAQRAAESPWTPRQRMAAQPLTPPELTPDMLTGALAAREGPATQGVPGFSPGSLPRPGAEAEARAEFPEEWSEAVAEESPVEDPVTESEEMPSQASTGAYTAFYGNKYSPMWKQHPYRAIGKLYFDTPGGPAYCTASVIGPDLIVTAARCILDTATDTVYANFSFCPAAKGSTCPYGTFPWLGAILQGGYLDAANWTDVVHLDVALIHLDNNRADRSVHAYTGWLGRSWNLPAGQHAFAFGYPATRSGNGFSYICAGETFAAGADILEMGCDSGFGHLGGPWLVNFAPYVADSTNYINNVTSYQYTRGRNAIGGPRFSMENIAGLCDAVPEC